MDAKTESHLPFLPTPLIRDLAIVKAIPDSFSAVELSHAQITPLWTTNKNLEEKFISDIVEQLSSKIVHPQMRNFLLNIPGRSGKSLLRFLVDLFLEKNKNALQVLYYVSSQNILVAGFTHRKDIVPALELLNKEWSGFAHMEFTSDVEKDHVHVAFKLL